MHVTPINLKPLTAVGKFKSPKLKVKTKNLVHFKSFCMPSAKSKTLSGPIFTANQEPRARETAKQKRSCEERKLEA